MPPTFCPRGHSLPTPSLVLGRGANRAQLLVLVDLDPPWALLVLRRTLQ